MKVQIRVGRPVRIVFSTIYKKQYPYYSDLWDGKIGRVEKSAPAGNNNFVSVNVAGQSVCIEPENLRIIPEVVRV